MNGKRKFSIFISSTYEDLKEERQALVGVALENNFIPVGMEQFHAAPTNQWKVITKMIDECDFYLLVIGGRYGSIDKDTNISYTEKEYNYAKTNGFPVLVLIKNPSTIVETKKDTGEDKYDKMQRLEAFRKKVEEDGNTVDYFDDLDNLRYKASATFGKAIEYAPSDSGWVRYRDIASVINEEAEERNKANGKLTETQQKMLEGVKTMVSQFSERLADLEKSQLTVRQIPTVTPEEIDKMFQTENEPSVTENREKDALNEEQDKDKNFPVEQALLLVYASDSDGQILKIRTLSDPLQIFISGKNVVTNCSIRESVKWEEALEQLTKQGLVKSVGYKGEIFEVTGNGYSKADWLKEHMQIDTSKDPIDELKRLKG